MNESLFNARLEPGETSLDLGYSTAEVLWIPDLFISNLRSLANTGFLDHPGLKLDVGLDKTVYYSRYSQVEICVCTGLCTNNNTRPFYR